MTETLLPQPYTVLSNKKETSDIFTLELKALDHSSFNFAPGQFNMVYLFGFGEVPISISSDPADKSVLLHTIRSVGPVTEGLRKLGPGEEVGIRGPFGTAWPLSSKGREVLIVAGGVALAPLRAALCFLAQNLNQYQSVTLLYGARTPQDMMYKEELALWAKQGITVEVSVDHKDDVWQGPVGVVTNLISRHVHNPKNTLALVCGPEIMMHFSVLELVKAQVKEEQIFLSMERNMQCATGFCGHCQLGPYFMCKDGPIFRYPQLKKWLAIKEL